MSDVSIAEYDQLLAQAATQLDLLRQTLANLQAKGMTELEAMASVVQMLWTWDQSVVIAALGAAAAEPRAAAALGVREDPED